MVVGRQHMHDISLTISVSGQYWWSANFFPHDAFDLKFFHIAA